MDKIIFTADGISVTVTKKRIRTLRLTVKPDKKVFCSAPLYCSEEKILAFVNEKNGWIRKTLEKYNGFNQIPVRYKDGEPFYFFGEKYTLRISDKGEEGITTIGGTALLSCDKDTEIETVIKKWYKTMLLAAAEKEIERYSRITGLNPSSVCIRDMKTRWGTCNVKSGKITFATGLARVPRDLFSYVVLHEILHLRVPDHGKNFKSLLDLYMPDWREKRKRLKSYALY